MEVLLEEVLLEVLLEVLAAAWQRDMIRREISYLEPSMHIVP